MRILPPGGGAAVVSKRFIERSVRIQAKQCQVWRVGVSAITALQQLFDNFPIRLEKNRSGGLAGGEMELAVVSEAFIRGAVGVEAEEGAGFAIIVIVVVAGSDEDLAVTLYRKKVAP